MACRAREGGVREPRATVVAGLGKGGWLGQGWGRQASAAARAEEGATINGHRRYCLKIRSRSSL